MVRALRFLFVFLFLFSGLAAQAQNGQDALRLRNGSLVFQMPSKDWIRAVGNSLKQHPELVIIHTNAELTQLQLEALRNQGITRLSLIDKNNYTAVINSLVDSNQLPAFITDITSIQPQWKLDKWTADRINTASKIEVIVSIVPGMQAEAEALFASLGATISRNTMKALGNYEISISAAKVYQLASWYGVRSIGRMAHSQPLNYQSRGATKALPLSLPLSDGGFGLLGDGLVVGVGDVSHGLDHIDLRDHTINFNPLGYNDHGMHVSGTVGARGIMDIKGEGFAPHATIINHFFENVWIQTAPMHDDYGMTITNNSYAASVGDCDYAGTYDVYSETLDQLMLDYDDVLHVFAAGNDGLNTCGGYPTSFGTIPGGFQTAKNVLDVGNVYKTYITSPGTSCGPTKDGRLKPEISAVGHDVYSTLGNATDGYNFDSGTSMAAPNVSGAAALLAQLYKALHGGTNPKNDLLKCLLMNGAMDLGNPGPDFTFGFGVMNALRSARMMDSNFYFTNSISTAGVQNTSVTVPANTSLLKVMLYWNDQPGDPLNLHQLVNDLDLEVIDPSASTHLPYVLDTLPANVNSNASTGVDRINNAEQIVISNPPAGSYTIRVNGFDVPAGPQNYVVSYDMVPTGVELTYPYKGVAVGTGDIIHIYWDASPGVNTFTLEISTNDGSSWTTISSSIPDTARRYTYTVPGGISSELCKMRITRNVTTETFTSGRFVINTKPVIALAAGGAQCPGAIRFTWTAVTSATGYQILQKVGQDLQVIATTTNLNFTITGLSLDSFYYVAMVPLINGVPGVRSNTLRRKPNTGTCAGGVTAYDGDLMTQYILAPGSGRLNTGSALTASENLVVRVRNLDNVTASNYNVSYQLDGGSWVSTAFGAGDAITAASFHDVTIGGLNVSAAGIHTLRVAVTNNALADPQHKNDTLNKTIRQLTNAVISLPFSDDFETAASINILRDTFGFTPNERWDFINGNDSGRMRTFVSDAITITGSRSISMDLYRNMAAVTNKLMGTFNLSSYTTASSEVRLSFDYKQHGIPLSTDSNRVFVRGSDSQPWQTLYIYDSTAFPGNIISSGSISLNDVLTAAGQDFSSSTQIAFSQRDTSVIASNDFGNGLTLDNVLLTSVNNDISVKRIASPGNVLCGSDPAAVLSVVVYNGVVAAQAGASITYRLDGGGPVTESLPSIPGKDSITYNFTSMLNLSVIGAHSIEVYVSNPGDNLNTNDTILDYAVHVQPLFGNFPYLENFEASEGSWFTEGQSDTWAYGTPASVKINKPASGNKAWKTNLAGNYNNLETSYLYSPCFDISGLTNPMLSFSVALDIENCGAFLCDEAHVEYTTDNGATWIKLGAAGSGTNWYNDASHQVWSIENYTNWHVASIPLPAAGSPIRFRFVLKSDPGTTHEGIAIDDIHIFDKTISIYDGISTGPVTQSVNSPNYVDFVQSGQLMAQINSDNQNLGSTDVTLFEHSSMVGPYNMQYFLPRSFVVNSANTTADSVRVRFYVLDAEVNAMLNAVSCPTCTRPDDAYRLGITKYDDPIQSNEDSNFTNNDNGIYQFYPYTNVTWVPYDNGYYGEVQIPGFSEFWFNNGGPTNGIPLPVVTVSFLASRLNESDVKLAWLSHIDTDVLKYHVQASQDGNNFSTIYSVDADHLPEASYSFIDHPNVTSGVIFYRLKWEMFDGKTYYSTVQRIDWTKANQLAAIYPNPSHDGRFTVNWSAEPGLDLQVTATDVAGREVYRDHFSSSGWNNSSWITLPDVKGLYFIHCYIGDQQFVRKVAVE